MCGLPNLLPVRLLPEHRRQRVLEALAGRRCLLVVDNFETVTDTEVLRFLKVLPEKSTALITCRHWHDIDDARVIELKGLNQQAASRLLQERARDIGLALDEMDATSLDQLHNLTDGVPVRRDRRDRLRDQGGRSSC